MLARRSVLGLLCQEPSGRFFISSSLIQNCLSRWPLAVAITAVVAPIPISRLACCPALSLQFAPSRTKVDFVHVARARTAFIAGPSEFAVVFFETHARFSAYRSNIAAKSPCRCSFQYLLTS